MSKPDTTLDPKILISAKKEFLEKGYLNASLKSICKDAGVTTGAIYNRYSGKEDLYNYIISLTLDEMSKFEESIMSRNEKLIKNNNIKGIWESPESYYKKWIDFIYDNFDGIKILLCCSDGTKYSNFLNDFVDKNTDECINFVKKAQDMGIKASVVDRDVLHLLLTAYWSTLFECVKHDYSKTKAIKLSKKISEFFNWKIIFDF